MKVDSCFLFRDSKCIVEMPESDSEVLKVGDYLVIVAYFVFVLLVGLWVR